MQYSTLGRTGLKVSVAGLGCGGKSRVGLKDRRNTPNDVVAHIRGAMDLGINFLDTAEWYGTEEVVGKAIAGARRQRVILSTKKNLVPEDHLSPEQEVRASLEQSLKTLGTDYVDIYHVHGAEPKDYDNARDRLLPAMLKLREEGKIRYIGITERFVVDSTHRMLERALEDDIWDVIMVGFNFLNPCARKKILPLAIQRNVGVLVMYALRRGLSQPAVLKGICDDLMRRGMIAPDALNANDPLDFLTQPGAATTLQDAAYRFSRHEPGVSVVLSGTGDPEHLRSNVQSMSKPALPKATLQRLEEIFGQVDWLTGN